MYGQPLKPSECNFRIIKDEEFNCGETTLIIEDNTEPSNDDVRDVLHPKFEDMWINVCENLFEPLDETMTIKQLEDWCVSIGMIKDDRISLDQLNMWRDKTIDIITNEFPFINFGPPEGRYDVRYYEDDLVIMNINNTCMTILVINPFSSHQFIKGESYNIISELYRILPKEFYLTHKRDIILNSILND